jgi:hypothetical protein
MVISDNLQPAAWGISMTFVVLTGTTCLLRFYSRLCISKSFGTDDWFMVAAFVGVPFPVNLKAQHLITCAVFV